MRFIGYYEYRPSCKPFIMDLVPRSDNETSKVRNKPVINIKSRDGILKRNIESKDQTLKRFALGTKSVIHAMVNHKDHLCNIL